MSAEVLKDMQAIDVAIKTHTSEKVRLEQIIQELNHRKEELKILYNKKLGQEQEAWEVWIDEFPWNEKIQRELVQTFHLKKFREHQLAAINATLSRKHVILLMPTGGGKSLCYQLPGMLEPGVTLVISPLISLMEDQIFKLKSLGITAYKMAAGECTDTKKAVYAYLGKGVPPVIKLLYISPEMLVKSKKLVSVLQTCFKMGNLNRIAIDEVHCCSQWGHDFRPDYRYLGMLRELFAGVPVIGLTATATTNVLNDIREMLDIPTATIIKAPFDRSNLFYKVIPKPSKFNACIELVNNIILKDFKHSSGIIYACTIKECEDIAEALKAMGRTVCIYHAQLTQEVKTNIYKKWMKNAYQIVIATIAFGLGIDKPDVRLVIHFTLPKTVEDLYQQGGRAGRDGKPATCIVLYRLSDYLRHLGFAKTKKETQGTSDILSYVLNLRDCRHALIGRHFEEDNKIVCGKMCDNCLRTKAPEMFSLNRPCAQIYEIIDQATKKENDLTLLKLLDAWYKVHSVPVTKEDAESLIAHLLRLRILKEEKCYTSYNVICYIKKSYDIAPEEGMTVYLANSSPLRRYLGVPPENPLKKRKFDQFCQPSTSKVKVEKIGE